MCDTSIENLKRKFDRADKRLEEFDKTFKYLIIRAAHTMQRYRLRRHLEWLQSRRDKLREQIDIKDQETIAKQDYIQVTMEELNALIEVTDNAVAMIGGGEDETVDEAAIKANKSIKAIMKRNHLVMLAQLEPPL